MAAAAVAAAAKNGVFRAQRHHDPHRLTCLWQKNCINHSIPDPPTAAAKNVGNRLFDQLRQSKWYSRFSHTKANGFQLPSPSLVYSTFSLRRSSSSGKFGFVAWYLGMIQARPVATKSITSAFIYTAADLSSQTITGESSKGYDLVRTLRMAGYGMLIVGPSLHYWFNFVSRLFPKRDLLSTFKKMALGQTVYGPTLTAIFFSANAALQGESGSGIVARLKRDLIPTLASGIMYWPICDFITFKFIPVHLQPLVSNSFSFLWTVYLTYMASLEGVSTS